MSEQEKTTRQRNAEARTAFWEAEAEVRRAAKVALQKVFEHPDSTPEQILEAARLLAELGGR